MSIGPAFRALWQTMPDRVTIVYRAQVTLGTYSDSAVSNAWWRPGDSGEAAPSFGVYTRSYRSWFVPKAMYADNPRVGDLIVNPVTDIDPSAVTWTVLGVSDVGALGAWKIDVVSLALQANLRSSGLIERPTQTQDATGRLALTAYTVVAADVPCRVQPEDGAASEVMDRVTIPYRFDCYLGYRVAVRARDRVTVDGTTYTILSSEMPERIDALQKLTLEVIL